MTSFLFGFFFFCLFLAWDYPFSSRQTLQPAEYTTTTTTTVRTGEEKESRRKKNQVNCSGIISIAICVLRLPHTIGQQRNGTAFTLINHKSVQFTTQTLRVKYNIWHSYLWPQKSGFNLTQFEQHKRDLLMVYAMATNQEQILSVEMSERGHHEASLHWVNKAEMD